MEHRCSLCPYFSPSVDDLYTHLLRRHNNAANFIIHCSVCGTSFRNRDSFRKHFYRRHYSEGQSEHIVDDNNCSALEPEHIDDEPHDVSRADEAAFVLKLKARHRLSQSAISDIMHSTKALVRSKLQKFHYELASTVDNAPNVMADNIFKGLENDYLQNKAFEQMLGYIKPVEVKLGETKCNRVLAGKYQLSSLVEYGYIVPFIPQLVQLLSMPEVLRCMNECRDDDEFLATDVDHGNASRCDPFLQQHPDALRIALYTDEFEIVNPIGSHKKKHKIIAFYWTLQNIPAEYRSKLSAIQLAALAKYSHVKKFGLDSLLKDMLDGLCVLYNGIDLEIPGYGMKKYFGKLSFVLADTLAAHSLGGFKGGVGGANKPCRTCEVKKMEMSNIHLASQCTIRDETEHRERITSLENVSGPTKAFWSKEWGINGNTVLAMFPVSR
jgi:hypothetical protein